MLEFDKPSQILYVIMNILSPLYKYVVVYHIVVFVEVVL